MSQPGIAVGPSSALRRGVLIFGFGFRFGYWEGRSEPRVRTKRQHEPRGRAAHRLYAGIGADRDSWKSRAEIAEAAIKRVEREQDANEKLADDVLAFVKGCIGPGCLRQSRPRRERPSLARCTFRRQPQVRARELRRKAELYDKEHGAK